MAGVRAAQAMRRAGFDGVITVVGDETHTPYDRPPLSKAFLVADDPSTAVRPVVPDLDSLGLEWRRGRSAVSLDAATLAVTLDDGEVLAADGVVLACGATARRLPGTEDLAGVHVLRTLDDAIGLRADLDASPRRVVVIGAGFIGAEVAASCRTRGLDVTVVEALSLPLGRVLPPDLGRWCADLHRAHGTELRLGVGVDGLDADGSGRVHAVRLADGTVIAADVVVVGIGVIPNTQWLDGSGLTIDNGVVCDATTLAAPGIVAAGDVARWRNPLFGESMRLEHWENAVDMGVHAGTRLLAADGDAEEFAPVPWFWSDQYDRKIQLAGRCDAGDSVELIEGTFDDARFVALIGRAERLKGVFGVNRPAVVNRWRQHIADGISWDDALQLSSG